MPLDSKGAGAPHAGPHKSATLQGTNRGQHSRWGRAFEGGPSLSAEVRTEVSGRLDAAAANLSYGLMGMLPLGDAAEGAVRLIEQAQRFLEVAAEVPA